MADILFAHSYHLALDPKQVQAMAPYPPLGTLYAAAVARERGLDVAVHDAMFEAGPESFAEALRKHAPRMVVIYEDSFHWLTKMCLEVMRRAALEMVAMGKAAGAVVAVNGSDCADHPLDYLKAGAELVIFGEGEGTLDELCGKVLGGVSDRPDTMSLGQGPPTLNRYGDRYGGTGTLEETPGLGYLTPTGALHRTKKRPLLTDLDALPLPARDLLDLAPYRAAWRRHGRFSQNLVTTRGCPFLCNWCAKPIYGNTYHSRSPESVASEMARLARDFGAQHLWFADDILGLKARWLAPFADAVLREKARLPFKCQTRADLMDDEHVDALARAGAEEVWLGAESGSQKILDAMEKGITVEQIKSAVRRLKARNIRVCLFLQFGYPGENAGDVEATRRLVRECRPDDIGISVSYPLPGTRFHDSVQSRLGEKRRWEHSNDLDPLFPGEYSRGYYGKLYAAVHAEFRTRRTRSPLWGARWLLAETRLRAARRSEVARAAASGRKPLPVL